MFMIQALISNEIFNEFYKQWTNITKYCWLCLNDGISAYIETRCKCTGAIQQEGKILGSKHII